MTEPRSIAEWERLAQVSLESARQRRTLADQRREGRLFGLRIGVALALIGIALALVALIA